MVELANAHSRNERLILKCAVELFAVKGFDETSIRDICTLSGVSRPVLYYYFESKNGLIAAVVQGICRHLRSVLLKARDQETSLREQCLTLIRFVFQDATENPLLWKLLLARGYSPTEDNEVAQLCTDIENSLQEAISRAMQRNEIEDIDASVPASILVGTIAFVLSKYLYAGRPLLSPALSETIVDTVFLGWGSNQLSQVAF